LQIAQSSSLIPPLTLSLPAFKLKMLRIDPPQLSQAIYLNNRDRKGDFCGSHCLKKQYYEISNTYPIRAEDDISYYNANIPVICPVCADSNCILLPNERPHGKHNPVKLPIKERCLKYNSIIHSLGANDYGQKQIRSVYERLDIIIKLCDDFETYLKLFHYEEYSAHMKAVNEYLYKRLDRLMQNEYIITLTLLQKEWTFFIRGERAQQLLTHAHDELYYKSTFSIHDERAQQLLTAGNTELHHEWTFFLDGERALQLLTAANTELYLYF
jgi:hypothetical protein